MALVTAPFFEVIELLFILGYRPELKARVRSMVQAETAKLNAHKEKATSGKAL
jgi:uncharacterized membrane protein YGL010W